MKLANAALYRRWLFDRRIHSDRVPWPDAQELFHRGRLVCILPSMRALWIGGESGDRPSWKSETWVEAGEGRFTRYLRADQVLDWIASVYDPDQAGDTFGPAIKELLHSWQVPVSEPLLSRREVLDRRIEAIRVSAKDGSFRWSRVATRGFPDAFRANEAGLDVVHTPESNRSGLTRYLCQGWSIDDDGKLIPGDEAVPWGPSTIAIPYRLCDAPRRLMLGASLQSRAVPLEQPEQPHETNENQLWVPPGRNLRAVFALHSGLTHEDAIVVSQSAADKLSRGDTHEIRVRVPAIVGRIESPVAPLFKGSDLDFDSPVMVNRGAKLLRAYTDLYALQWRRHEAETVGATDGWLDLNLDGAEVLFDGLLVAIRTRVLRSTRWRLLVRFVFASQALAQGSKLATRHGIKGVVSRILPDDQMPETANGRAEVILSPTGILKRGALGQFREAADGKIGEQYPRYGSVFLMRQTQEAWTACRVRGAARGARGQRYGEMEFWALMAHAAPEIASELLSVERSTARWLQKERQLSPEAGHRTLSRTALNRYLAVVGASSAKGRLSLPAYSEGTVRVELNPDVPSLAIDIKKSVKGISEIIAELDNEEWFQHRGGTFALDLRAHPLVLSFDLPGRRKVSVVFEALYLLPPWLRPSGEHWHSELTRAYRALLYLIGSSWAQDDPEPMLRRALRRCVEATFDVEGGGSAGRFLRREVLGRRLTRSARTVIVPDPDLRVDQIRIPQFVADELFSGLPEPARQLVLVNRNPTLHRRGLLALRPIIATSNAPVFGLPLGILSGMGADFDGDQVSVVALERESSLKAAERLLPGAQDLRVDRFRHRSPMFFLGNELADSAEDYRIAAENDHLDQVAWCETRATTERARLARLGDGWELLSNDPDWKRLTVEHEPLWRGQVSEGKWLERANREMESVYLGVRRKGQFGGILRRQLYARDVSDPHSLFRAVDALSAITERIVQKALSVKSDSIQITMSEIAEFFRSPSSSLLGQLDQSFDPKALLNALGEATEPRGLLAFMASPTLEKILSLSAEEDPTGVQDSDDPRWAWFLS
jgi:hypothetical protein